LICREYRSFISMPLVWRVFREGQALFHNMPLLTELDLLWFVVSTKMPLLTELLASCVIRVIPEIRGWISLVAVGRAVAWPAAPPCPAKAL
jgi:hypothetical protein